MIEVGDDLSASPLDPEFRSRRAQRRAGIRVELGYLVGETPQGDSDRQTKKPSRAWFGYSALFIEAVLPNCVRTLPSV
jgi:hypothetical protein